MVRLAQVLALCLSIGLLGVLACRAQQGNQSPPPPTPTGAPAPDAAAPPVDAAAPEVYLPASKSGGVLK